MNTLSPLFGHSLPASAWSDAAPGAGRPRAEPGAPVPGLGDWFGASASGRPLSVQRDANATGDVDAWAKALIDHLLEPGDEVR